MSEHSVSEAYDAEKHDESHDEHHADKDSVKVPLKLDKHGLPLVPQPSQFKDDPLNWSPWLKWAVLIQVSFMAFLGPFNSAVVNPSLVLLSDAMRVDTTTVAYNTTTAIIIGGVASFILTPLTNVYGRRPVTLFSLLIAVIGGIGSAVSPNFGVLIGTRIICGFGMSGMMSVGTAVVNDLFFLHERGEKTGVYAVFLTNGAPFAIMIGGYLGQAAGWQWDFWLPAIITGLSLVVALFLFPETLFSRDPQFLAERTYERTYSEMLWNWKGNLIPGRKLHKGDFLHTIYMLKYPSITIPAWYYLWAWTFIKTLPAISIAAIYSKKYHFKSGPIGLSLGIALIIGCLLGELFAGRLSDYVMYRMAKRHNGERKPEFRLYLTTISALFMPIGMIMFGVCVEHTTPFVAPLIGVTISVFGLQIATTCLYAYVSDCYKPQTPESGVLFNLSRGLSFTVGYYALPFAEKSGFDIAWSTFAVIQFVFWFPIGALMIWGEGWRKKLGQPTFHRYM